MFLIAINIPLLKQNAAKYHCRLKKSCRAQVNKIAARGGNSEGNQGNYWKDYWSVMVGQAGI